MKTVIVLGSPRKDGNSTYLGEVCGKRLEEAGDQVTYLRLQDMEIHPCRHCEACRHSQSCVIHDDMATAYQALEECDRLVIAAPVYWFTMNGQTKIFLDRLYAMAVHKGSFPWKVGVLMTGEGKDPFDSGAVNAFRAFQDMFSYLEADLVGLTFVQARERGEARANPKAAEEAVALANKLLK